MGGQYSSQLGNVPSAIGLIMQMSSIYISTQAQRIPGFLSIDCGSESAPYTDPFTAIVWEGDDKYIQTGMNARMSKTVSSEVNSTYGNSVALTTCRYFPEPRKKHCYELPTNGNSSFLLRAMFWNGGSPLLISPTTFSVAVNSTVWFNVTYNLNDTPFVREAIFFSPGNWTYFCLVPITGVPFISSLELRELDQYGAMYSGLPASSTDSLFLYSLKRLNCGAQQSSPSVRYPDDSYDRLWYSPASDDLPIDPTESLLDVTAPVNSTTTWGIYQNAVPQQVIESAWLDDSPNSSFWMGFSFDSWVSKVYIALYFKSYNEYDATATDRMFYIFLNTNPDVQKSFKETITVKNHDHLFESYSGLQVPNGYAEFIFRALPNSTRGPIVNAIELYAQVNFNTSATAAGDVDALKSLQLIFNLTNWQGDPCYPVLWDWVSCTSDPVQARVNKLLLSGLTSGRRINASIPSIILNLTLLTDMNLSHNALSSLPSKWQSTSSGSLVVLDLSQNNLSGNITSLDQLVEINAASLQEIYVANNSLAGTFDSTLYFSRVRNLTIAIFDGNSIEGTLDLSLYLKALKVNATQASQKLFSFKNNNISNIVPNAEAFESALKSLQGSDTDFINGILLGGNPYCDRAKSNIQRFLCRPAIHEKYTAEKSNYHRDILIIGICVGVVAFVLSSITGATMWRLWKQVYALRKIQQALADQKVQPPFYQYSDLKSATRDFHQENKLGKGGFGEVFKGVLPDKTELAVKKLLFNAHEVQALNEFLNEVVLITGIKHRNLVQLKGCCIREQQRLLIYEYVDKGNLAQALWGSKAHGSLNWEQRFSICVGVARGLSYLHEELQPCIIHRDIKPENILLDMNLKPKIADFGLAKQLPGLNNKTLYTANAAGTLGYFSPEYATQGQISDKVDVYSYGIVVLEVVSGRNCIDHSLPLDKVFLKNWVHALHKEGRLFDVLEPELRETCVVAEVIQALNIALLCVQPDPKSRPSMSQVVTMFSGLNVDVEASLASSLEESQKFCDYQFQDLLGTTHRQTDYPALNRVIEDEPSDLPFLNSGFECSFEYPSRATSGSKSSFEISYSKQ